MPIIDPPEFQFETIHTTWRVVVTTYSWSRGGRNIDWSKRQPAYQNGLVERGSVTYGDQVADWCNANHINYLTGFYQPPLPNVDNPLVNFRNSLWKTGRLGNLKLIHMFGLLGYPGTRQTIKNEVLSWARDMESPKYGRIKDAGGASRPILMWWGDELKNDTNGFVTLLNEIRQFLKPRVGDPFIIGTQHLADLAANNWPGSVNALLAADGLYQHNCPLPWEKCVAAEGCVRKPDGTCNCSGVEWDAVKSAQVLGEQLTGKRDLLARHGRIFFGGTMPHFDRDLFSTGDRLADHGRVVAKAPDQLRTLLRKAQTFGPVVHSEERTEAGETHIYEDRWIILTSFNEWEEGSTFEPCIVRGAAYSAPGYDYGTDGLAAISEVFRDTVVRRRVRV